MELNWVDPPNLDPTTPTLIQVDGADVLSVPTDATTATLGANQVPFDRPFSVAVIHCGGIAAECSPFKTDLGGYIVGGSWLALGPFATPVGCDGNADLFLENSIGPVEQIACQFPANGDAIDGYAPGDPLVPDPATSSTLAYNSNAPTGDGEGGEGDLPIWRPFQGATLANNDLDFDQDVAGNLNEHVLWVATWVRNKSDRAIPIQACLGSDDDSQAWLDSQLLINFVHCAGRGDCDTQILFDLPPGDHVFKIGVWEQGGGWGARFALASQEDGLPIVDLGDVEGEPFLDINQLDGISIVSEEIEFLGHSRPGSEDDYECTPPQSRVTDLVCERTANSIEPACGSKTPERIRVRS